MTKGDGQRLSVEVPADYNGKSIDADIIHDIVDEALFRSGPIVARNHIHGAFNDLYVKQDYASAVRLAGLVMRYAQEVPR